MLIVWNLVCGQCLGVLAFVRRLLGYLLCIAKREPYRLTSDQLGRQAELLAARFFMRRGYSILERRVQTEFGEMDLVLIDHWHREPQIVIVEVKASFRHEAQPQRRLKVRQRQRLELAARQFLKQQHLRETVWRLELVAVVWPMPDSLPLLRRFPVDRLMRKG